MSLYAHLHTCVAYERDYANQIAIPHQVAGLIMLAAAGKLGCAMNSGGQGSEAHGPGLWDVCPNMHGVCLLACKFDAGSRNKRNKCFAATGPIRFDLLLRL